RDEPEPAEIERTIELMPGCNQRLAVLRAQEHLVAGGAVLLGRVDPGDRRPLADREPGRRGAARYGERRKVLGAEAGPERIRDLARLPELVGGLLDDLLVRERPRQLVPRLPAAARSLV